MKTFKEYLTESIKQWDSYADWKSDYENGIISLNKNTYNLKDVINDQSEEFIFDAVRDRGYDNLKYVTKTLSPEFQLTSVQRNGRSIIYIQNPTKEALNYALTNPIFIKFWSETYDKFITELFKDNSLLINKWLRYAKNIREQE